MNLRIGTTRSYSKVMTLRTGVNLFMHQWCNTIRFHLKTHSVIDSLAEIWQVTASLHYHELQACHSRSILWQGNGPGTGTCWSPLPINLLVLISLFSACRRIIYNLQLCWLLIKDHGMLVSWLYAIRCRCLYGGYPRARSHLEALLRQCGKHYQKTSVLSGSRRRLQVTSWREI